MNGLCWCACQCERCRQAASNLSRVGGASGIGTSRPLSPRPLTSDRLIPPPPLELTPSNPHPTIPVRSEIQQQQQPYYSNSQTDQEQQQPQQHSGGGGVVKPPKNRRPPPAPLSDGSPAPLPQPRPNLPLDGSVKTCLAVDRYQVLCDQVVVGGWKGKVNRLWCQVHEEEEKNVRTSFWNAVSSLPKLSRSSPLPNPSEITNSSSFQDLESWEQTSRQHIELARTAYESWEYHREHFSASEIDLVDRLEGRGEGPGQTDLARGAWEEVRLRGEKAEAVLKLIIRRSHFLACDAEDALWLLHTDGCPHNHSYSGCYGSSDEGSDEEASQEDDEDDDDEDSQCSCCSHHSHSSTCEDDSHSHSHHNHHHGHHHGGHHHHHHQHNSHHHHHHRSSDPNEKAPHNPLRPPGSPTLAPEQEEPDPLNALETLRRTELLELLSLTGSHASFIREGRKSVERVRIVECLFRRLISRDEELLVKAYRGGHDHVLRFFEDPALVSLPALARLHHALQRTSPTELKEAIMDAFRAIAWEESGATETEDGPEGVGMQVLGGWVYKNQLSRSMTPREWSHLYDLCACPGCAIRCCMRFTDLTLIRRLTVIPHGPHPPPFELWAEPEESDAQKIYKALDVVWCEGKEVDDEGKARRMRLGGEKGREVWAIREERNWAFIKISLHHPYASPIIMQLHQHFTLIGRSRNLDGTQEPLSNLEIPPPHLLWTNRVRHAPTKAALSKPPPSPPLPHSSTISVATLASTPSPWRAYPNSFNCVPTSHSNKTLMTQDLLKGFDSLNCPEKEQDLTPFEDCYELLVLDAPIDSGFAQVENYLARPLQAFECFLAGVLSQACGLEVPNPNKYINGNSSTHSIDDVKKKKEEEEGGGGEVEGMTLETSSRILHELKQSALEHGAVESFLRGDLVWDFGDVKGVTTPRLTNNHVSTNGVGGGNGNGKKGNSNSNANGGGSNQVFLGVDLKKVGKDGIVAPPLPPPGVIQNLPNGSKKINPVSSSTNNGKSFKLNGNSSTRDSSSINGSNGGNNNNKDKDKKEKVLEGLRDDKLALRLARSLFK